MNEVHKFLSQINFVDKTNTFFGAITAALTVILGKEWYLFALFLMFNVFDWITGWHKAYKKQDESSKKGFKGIIKKLSYWVIIAVAFSLPSAFIPLGDMFGIDMSFLLMLGWLTLAMLMVNEARSILENLAELGVNVPPLLIKGLAVTEKLINSKTNKNESEEKTDEQH